MFCIIDGQHMTHRHYYSKYELALPWRAVFKDKFGVEPLKDEEDNIMSFKTGMVFGFLQSLKSLQEKFEIESFFIAWEGGNLKRAAAYADYKADRGTPEKPYYMDQYRILKRVLSLLGIRQFATVGYEADDICAAMAKRLRNNQMPCIIISGDHDLFQCVSKDGLVRLYRPSMSKNSPDVLYDYIGVQRKFDFPPENLKDIWAISGDDSDYVKGVHRVGEVTATKILKDNDVVTVEELLNKGEDLKATPAKKKAILELRDQILLNKELVTLYEDCEINEVENTIEDFEQLEDIFKELSLSKYLINFDFWKKFCR